MRTCSLILSFLCAVLAGVATARAATCTVPSGPHPTIQAAVDDLGCTEVVVGAGTFIENPIIGRTLSVTGASPSSSVIAGRVVIGGGASAVVSLTELSIDGSHAAVAGCFVEAVDVGGGARMVGGNIVVVNGDGDACVLFEDGFEDGTTDAWFVTVP
jgi:hypothetical protein